MNNLSQLFSLLSDPSRLKILALLSKGERCVCKLYEPLGLQQSVVSRHLMLLRTAGVVVQSRLGTWMHYRLAPELWKSEWKEILPLAIAKAEAQLNEITPELFIGLPPEASIAFRTSRKQPIA
jgi:ArsR family transcriptional regulator, arsenate/arsenite/antimonite-responsive transcriptional repressor